MHGCWKPVQAAFARQHPSSTFNVEASMRPVKVSLSRAFLDTAQVIESLDARIGSSEDSFGHINLI